MRMFALTFALATAISHQAIAQTPADLARLIGPQASDDVSASAAPTFTPNAGEFTPTSLARLLAPTGAATPTTSPTHLYAQAFGPADLARLRDGALTASNTPAPDRIAATMVRNRRMQ